jgi:transcriptional regulator with XRE-family HTH domain
LQIFLWEVLDLKINQDDFAKKIGLTKNYISLVETGGRVPSDRTILDICREFNVNEYWLRTGDGEMFRKKSRGEEIMEYAAKVAGGELDEFQTALFSTMSKLSAEQMALLADIAKKMVEEYQKEKASQ